MSVCGQLSSEQFHEEGRRETRGLLVTSFVSLKGANPSSQLITVQVSNAVGDDKLISDDFVAWGAMNDRKCKLLTR